MAVQRTNTNGDNNLYFSTSQSTLPKSMAAEIETSEYQFNEIYYQSLVNEGNYDYANRYLECFHFKNPNDEYALNEKKLKLKSEAAKSAEYTHNINTISDKQTRDDISFMNNFFTNTAILDNSSDGNETWNNYKYFKKCLGSKLKDNGDIEAEATQLQIEFAPAQSKALGFIPVDNDDSFESFLTRIGMTEQQLQESGIEIGIDVQTKNKTIKFRKDSKLANQIIYQLSYRPDKGFLDSVGDKSYKIIGYDDNNNQLYKDSYFTPSIIEGSITNQNPYKEGYSMNRTMLSNLAGLFRNANNAKKEFDNNDVNGGIKKLEQSIIVGSLTSDDLMNYDQFAQANGIKSSEYRSHTEYLREEIINILKSGPNNAEIYTNIYSNEDKRTVDETNRTLKLADTDKYQETLDRILASNNVIYAAGYMGDVAGIYITIPTGTLSNNDVELERNKVFKDGDSGEYPSYNVFIPGFCTEIVNELASKDPKLQANKETQFLQNLNYTYTFTNGESIRYSKAKNSYVYYDPQNRTEETISNKDAEDYILQDKAIQMFSNEIIRNNIRTNGTIDNNNQISDYVMGLAAGMLRYVYSEEDYDFIKYGIDADKLFSTDENGYKSINNLYEDEPLLHKWVNPLNTIGYIHNMVMRNVSRHYSQNMYSNKNK